jgi:hypothetical protein
MSDERVNYPAHYNMGGSKGEDGTAQYETIKVIEDWGLGFKLGNALKYILRAPHKGTELQDLSKARWYLDRHARCGKSGPNEPERTMLPPVVADAWNLPIGLANVIRSIHFFDSREALVFLDEYISARSQR